MTELLGEDSRPMFISVCCYVLLVVVYGSILVYFQGLQIHVKWWKFVPIGMIDSAAAYFTLLSLRFTSVTSWSLLQPLSFVVIIPLSILLLHARYSWKHFLSAIVAIAGVIVLLLSDFQGAEESETHSAKNIIRGDLLAILGTTLYGTNTVLVEAFLKDETPQYEVLSLLGIFGGLFGSIVTILIGEISSHLFPNTSSAIFTFLIALANFGFYAIGSVVLKYSGAAVLEISLLSSNLWSLMAKLLIIGGFHTHIVGFIFAFGMILAGVSGFVLSGNPYPEHLPYKPLETEMSVGSLEAPPM